VKVTVSAPEGAQENFKITEAGHTCTEKKPNNNVLVALKKPIGKKPCQGCVGMRSQCVSSVQLHNRNENRRGRVGNTKRIW